MSAPLAERLRPTTIDGYIGQNHLVGVSGIFQVLRDGQSAIVYALGASRVGKTTLAKLVAATLKDRYSPSQQ